MPAYKNPFEVLGISLDEAQHLGHLKPSLRKGSLSFLRRYFASIYHPDRTRNPDDDKILAEINGALATLEDNTGFSGALEKYRNTRPQSTTGSYRAMMRQIQYLRNQSEKRIKEAESSEQRVEEKYAKVAGLERQINILSYQVGQLQDTENLLKMRHAEARKNARKLSIEYRKNLLARIKSLNLSLLDGGSVSVPENAVALNQVGNKRYVINERVQRKRIRRLLRINQNLGVVDEGDTLEQARLNESLLIGGLEAPDRVGIITSRSKGYDQVLFNLKAYLRIGMCPVVEMIRDKGYPKSLYVYREIIDITPLEVD